MAANVVRVQAAGRPDLVAMGGRPRQDRVLSVRQAAIVWIASATAGWGLTVGLIWVLRQLV